MDGVAAAIVVAAVTGAGAGAVGRSARTWNRTLRVSKGWPTMIPQPPATTPARTVASIVSPRGGDAGESADDALIETFVTLLLLMLLFVKADVIFFSRDGSRLSSS
jgi:hypothetical protein